MQQEPSRETVRAIVDARYPGENLMDKAQWSSLMGCWLVSAPWKASVTMGIETDGHIHT